MQLQQPEEPTAVAEDDQVLAEDAQGKRQVFQLAGEGDGLPVAAQVLAARCAGPDVRQLGVRRGHLPGEIGSIGHIQKNGLGVVMEPIYHTAE